MRGRRGRVPHRLPSVGSTRGGGRAEFHHLPTESQYGLFLSQEHLTVWLLVRILHC